MVSGRGGSGEPSSQLRKRLQSMNDYDFENFIGDLWRIQGWDAEVVQQSRDAGVDVRVRKQNPYPRKVLIQAKRYGDNTAVSSSDIQQYASLKHQESGVDEVIVVTTSRFTDPAEDRAQKLNVKTIDGKALVKLIDQLDAYDIVKEYTGRARADPNSSTGSQSGQGRSAINDLSPEEREAIEHLTGQSVEEFVREEPYRSTRALERMSGWVKINPSDARRIGIFDNLLVDGLSSGQVERLFPDETWKIIFLKEDLHLDGDGVLFVENLTEYVPDTVIKGDKRGPIVGRIERGVPDGHWMSDEGEAILAGKERFEQFVSWANDGLERLKSRYSEEKRKTATTSTRDSTTATATETVGETAVADNGSEGYYTVVASTVGWLLSVFLMGIADQFPVLLFIPLACWFLLPVGLLMDRKQTELRSGSRTARLIPPQIEVGFYVLVSLIPWVAFFSGIAYLYRRHRILEE